MITKQKMCSFTGHRPNKLQFGYNENHEDCINLKLRLAAAIEEMRGKGVTTFLSGMALGTDIWCAEIVLDLRRAYPGDVIRLMAVLPYENQADNWSEKYRERYFDILARCDDVIILQAHYTKDCMFKRNRYLVDSSAHVIAVYNGKKGGTQYTVNYAINKGLDLMIIDPDTLKREELKQQKGRVRLR